MRNKIANLVEVRKIVTLLFAGVFAYMAITKQLTGESVLSILTMIFGYYFGKSTALDERKSDKI